MSIKLIVMDVDGVLTDCGLTHHSDGSESKTFNAKDGLIVRAMPSLGIDVMFLTGRKSIIVDERAQFLKVKCVMQGVGDKKKKLEQYMTERNISKQNVAFIGDDVQDLEAMRLCSFKSCPIDAVEEVKAICDYISPIKGGHGAVRDICEFILKRENKYADFLALFGIETIRD